MTSQQERVRKAVANVQKLVAKEDVQRQRVKDARAKAAQSPRATTKNALIKAREAFAKARQAKLDAQNEVREAKRLLRASVAEVRETARAERVEARKARAREKAVAAFVKKWDRDYDRLLKEKEKSKAGRKPRGRSSRNVETVAEDDMEMV